MKKLNKLLVSLFIFTLLITSWTNLNKTKIIEIESNKNILATNKSVTKRNISNIAVFIKFDDSDTVVHHLDDKQSVENAYKIFNSDELFEMNSVNGIINVPSFKKYYERESYGNLSITTDIFPKINGEIISYKDSHPIGYYLSYSSENTIGYKDKNESNKREKELLEGALSYIKSQVEAIYTADNLDTDKDGDIDAITFIVEASDNPTLQPTWGSLLWSHKSSNTGININLSGKNVNAYTLVYARDYTESAGTFSLNRGEYGTLIHEFGHVLGYRDLYRYNDPSSKPVGFYDVMGNVIGSNPQSFLTYFTSEFSTTLAWHNKIPVITDTTDNITLYKPEFIDPNEKRAIKLEIGGNKDEYFIVEYYDRLNTYESHRADSSGIIIYRVNEKNKYNGNGDGSNQGKNEHIYIFRPGETGLGDSSGNLSEATLNMKRKTYGVELDLNSNTFNSESIFFSDGTNSGIQIEVTGETNNSVTFNIKYPDLDGDGTKDNPYLIKDINTYLYHMTSITKNKYYKLANDLDFTNITYPIINFEGNLDGNNKTLKNITTNGSGVFNNIGNYDNKTTIENLIIENLVVYSNKGDYLGGFASVGENININNVHLKNGSVTNDGSMKHDLASTGGFIGNVYSNVTITNSSSNLDVTAEKNIGGFIGLNQNAFIKDSFANGTIIGNNKIGGFIGIQSITDTIYKTPENVYYNNSNNLNGVGGYSFFHNLNILDENSLSKGIISIKVPNTLELLVNSKISIPVITNPTTPLTYNVEIESSDIAKYESDKLTGLKKGNTKVYLNIIIGTSEMKLALDVTVKEMSGTITEEIVLNYLGLTKKDNYLVGFTLGDKVENIKNSIEAIEGVTLKSFTDANNNEITDSLIGTGMKFTINLNNMDYTYTVIIKGDVNGDGLIYATDYVKVRNHIMGKTQLTGAYLLAADINNDGKIYATDYVQIKNHIMGKTPIKQN